MPGAGPAPKVTRRRRNAPARGEWRAAPGIGWQHGRIPKPPDGLRAESLEAWQTWFKAWFAAHWTPADLPGLRLLIAQHDAVQRGQAKANDITALVRLMDTYGITPAGQQARRWQAPTADEPADPPAKAPRRSAKAAAPDGGRYGHLRAVG